MSVFLETCIALTNTEGGLLNAGKVEPTPGSVVLVKGPSGTAWQRQFDDGLWRSVRSGKPRTWEFITSQRNVVLVYLAEPRSTAVPQANEREG